MDVIGFAKKRLLARIKDALKKSQKEGRLVFGDDKVGYTDKEGQERLLTLDELAAFLWDKINVQLGGAAGKIAMVTGSIQPNLAIVGISPDDIKGVLEEIKKSRK